MFDFNQCFEIVNKSDFLLSFFFLALANVSALTIINYVDWNFFNSFVPWWFAIEWIARAKPIWLLCMCQWIFSVAMKLSVWWGFENWRFVKYCLNFIYLSFGCFPFLDQLMVSFSITCFCWFRQVKSSIEWKIVSRSFDFVFEI